MDIEPFCANKLHDIHTERNATRTDLSKCKLTQLGTDYMGSITTTAGGIRCQMWDSEKPLHQVHSYYPVTMFSRLCLIHKFLRPTLIVSKSITDKDFPEGSLRLVRNYCRNPTKDPKGPWCYTMDPNLIDDECEVPLCNFGGENSGFYLILLYLSTIPKYRFQLGDSFQLMPYSFLLIIFIECRISGTGSEYGGTRETSSSGRKCNSWDKRLKLAVNKTEKFSSNHFSDLSRNKAKNFCRNPDSSAGGPWCYVDSESYDIVEKEYCSVPFCDDKDCLVYTKNASTYSILTSLNSAFGNITFLVKLWDPGDEQIGQARLLLTNLQVPSSAEMIAQKWGAGVEILISNSGSGQKYPRTDEEIDFEETPNILTGTKWTTLWVTWGGGFISVGRSGSSKPIFLDEFRQKNTISSMYPESFFQYGITGTGILWSMPFCEATCEVHTTFGLEFLRIWPLLQSNSSHDLQFQIRASHGAMIQLTQTPAVPFPRFLVVLGQSGSTLLLYQEKETSTKKILLDIETKQILNFWAWHEFTISIFGMAIQMFWHRDYGREKVFSIQDDAIQTVRWFSIGSENTIAYWTLFCTPTAENAVEAPWFPNCISNSADSRYEGSQWMAEGEVPCVPWIFDKVRFLLQFIPKEDREDDHFIDGSALKALNKCRNPTNDPEGPYCYTLQDLQSSVEKQYCSIRKCRSSECRMAGTANDYIGVMSVTRSGRKCARWWTGYNQTNVTTKKTPSFKSLMVKALTSLKFKRENALEYKLPDTINEPWDKIGLRSGLPKDFDFGHTPRRVARSYKQSEVDKLVTPHGLSINSDRHGTLKSVGDGDWLQSNSSTRQLLARYNLFNLNRRLLQEQETLKKVNLHPIFNPYQAIQEITTELNGKDEFFNMARETVPQENISRTTSESSNSISTNPPYGETSEDITIFTTSSPQSKTGSTEKPFRSRDHTKPIHPVDPLYLNDTLYPEQSVKSAINFCRNPSRNIAGAWCYTTDPEVPQDLCNVRDCEQPEECIFLVRGHGSGRRLYVLPDYRSEGLQFSLKEWEPDRPDSITFTILSEDDVKSRFILKVGAMKNEKVLLYYETEGKEMKLVKEKTLPHLLYLGKWTGFVIRMERGGVKLYYEGAPFPLFEWEDPEPAKAFLPVYYHYSSEKGNTIGVAFKCNTSITTMYIECHIEETTTDRFTRILPISIWETEETPSPHRLVLMVRGQGVILLPLLMLPTMPVYYALTIGEKGRWVFFMKNKLPVVHVLHKQNAKGPLFNSNTWTNLTVEWISYMGRKLYTNRHVHLSFYKHDCKNLPQKCSFYSTSKSSGYLILISAISDIDGSPVDGGWSEWGPWRCSVTCNGGIGVRKRICNDPEPNIRGQPCLGPSTSSGRCNMNKCDDVTDVTLELVKRKIRTQHTSLIVKEGDGVKLLADPDIVSALRNETPKSDINWSRNGIFLEEEEDRIKLEDTAVSISYTIVNDSGVYTQTLHRLDDSHLIFKIITLAVIPVVNEIVTRETLSFSMTCHCVVLGYVYSDLKISWKLNGQVFKDYGVSTPVAVNVDHVRKVNTSHRGEWRCEVEQKDLNFKWTTNVVKVRVLGPPNWRTHLMEDELTRPIFGWMPNESFVAFSAFLLTFLIIAAIIASTIWYLRYFNTFSGELNCIIIYNRSKFNRILTHRFRESLKYKEPQTEKLIGNEESESENLIDDKKR
ncbi:uncharacterized protein LOC124406546 [Diprion similis]|uniref:uncharacterized protein LOC124406546 n=1 Tax=Diprion similis TaxID=362088 RepID=UPI001EF76D8C|nr:uncharacterized protein LOC124406546 [Diprion similis]